MPITEKGRFTVQTADWIQLIVPIVAIIGSVRFIIVREIDGVNKRIDDLRSQMSREHDALAKIADGISTRLDSLEDKFARHLETHP